MTRVVVHIGRLVVHGDETFASEKFAENLQHEIARRIGQGASAADIAHKLQANAPSAHHGPTPGQRRQHYAHRSTESMVASEVAGRLLK